MVLSKREKYIAIGVAAAVGIFVLNSLALNPYMSARSEIEAGRAKLDEDNKTALATFERAKKLSSVWSEMERGGLMVDSSVAESQSQQAILDWAKSAGVDVASVRPERATTMQKFQIINFSMTGNGSLWSISKLLSSLETSAIPVRVTEITINPRREGTDDLTVRLSISALCMPPGSDRTTAVATGGGA